MTVTLTEVHRRARQVVRAAQSSAQPVTITDHGQPVAELRGKLPARIVTEEEFLAAEITDEAIVEALNDFRQS